MALSQDLPRIRFRKLGYVELNVTDLERAFAFYQDTVGLQCIGRGAYRELRFRCTNDTYAIVLHQATEAGFKRVGWMLEHEREFDNLCERLKAHHIRYEELSAAERGARELGRTVRMVEPSTGATQEFYVPPPGHLPPWTPTLAKIQRLGHVVWRTPKFEKGVAFFRDVLNFVESDSIGRNVTFLRCFPSPYHHGIGILRSPDYGLHHVNFMVTEIDDIGRALHRFNARKVPITKGPGRHPVSGSVFLYYLDPDGMTLEYSFGMEEFPENDPRPPQTYPPGPRSTDLWDGPTDSRQGRGGVIERYLIGQPAA